MFKSLYCSSFALKPLLKLLLNSSRSLTLLSASLNSRAFTASSLYIPLPLFPSLSLSLCSVTKHKQILCRLLAPFDASAVWNSPQRVLWWVRRPTAASLWAKLVSSAQSLFLCRRVRKQYRTSSCLAPKTENQEQFPSWSILKRTLL